MERFFVSCHFIIHLWQFRNETAALLNLYRKLRSSISSLC